MTTSVKTCFKCHVEKPITDFYAHPKMGDGRLNKCKECAKKDVTKNYRDNIEHYREYERKRFSDPKRKRQARKYVARRKRRSPEKVAASNMTSNAIRSGRLVRPSCCTRCGSDKKIEAHHPDYSKPLDVVWLCFKCHRAEHGQVAA